MTSLLLYLHAFAVDGLIAHSLQKVTESLLDALL